MSILNVNQIQPVGGGNTITVSASDVNFSGNISIGSSFVGTASTATLATTAILANTATVATNAQGLTGTPNITVNNIHSGIVTATTFIGDGSGITGVTASGSGISIKDSASTVGVAATVDFGTNLNVSPASAGIVTVTVGDTDFEIVDKIVHTGDTDTTLRFPAADTITAETGGSEAFRIDSSGRLQIGASNNTGTNTKLVVGAGNNINTTAIINTGDVDVNALTLSNWDGSTTTNKLMMHFDSSGIGAFNIGMPAATDAFVIDDGGTERVRIDSSGRLLIGTTTEGSGGADELTIATSGDSGMTIRSGTSSAGGIYFSDGTSGSDEYRGVLSYNHAENAMRFYTDGSEKIRITSDGRVSIGGMAADTGVNLHIESSGEANFLLEGSASTVGGYLMLKNKDNTANSSMSIQFLDASGQGVSEINGVAVSDSNNQGYLAIKTRDSGASMIEAARFASDNTFHLATTGSDDIVYSLQTGRAQHSNSQSKVYSITGLAWGQITFKIGVSDGNAKYGHFAVLLGGSMWGGGNGYNATPTVNDASGVNISLNKQDGGYHITIANAGNSNTLYGAWQLEASLYSNLGKPTLTIS